MSFIKQLLTSKDNLSKMSILYQCSPYFRTNADLLIKKSINFLCEKDSVDQIFRANVDVDSRGSRVDVPRLVVPSEGSPDKD
jgi:hypothetical protein